MFESFEINQTATYENPDGSQVEIETHEVPEDRIVGYENPDGSTAYFEV